MNKFTLLFILVFSYSSIGAQTTIFEDDFESYPDFTITNFGNWTLYDLNGTNTWGVGETDFPHEGEPMAGIIFNPQNTSNPSIVNAPNYSIHISGQKYFTFWTISSSNSVNDKYLITPLIDLQNANNPVLTFYAKSLASASSPGITPEQFEVLISTTGNNVSDFTTRLGPIETNQRVGDTWDEYTRDLTPYIGNQVYIAIHYISPSTSYALHLDDFKVTDGASSVDSENTINFSYYPNPVDNILNIKAQEQIVKLEIVNALGQTVYIKKENTMTPTVDTSNLTSGIYFVSIFTNHRKSTFRIVKQ